MKRIGLSPILLSLSLGVLAAMGASGAARAEQAHEYEIAANDGYGLEDCLAAGSECGQVVADAWCEAHGHGHALAYGLRSSVEDLPAKVSTANEPYVIKCGE